MASIMPKLMVGSTCRAGAAGPLRARPWLSWCQGPWSPLIYTAPWTISSPGHHRHAFSAGQSGGLWQHLGHEAKVEDGQLPLRRAYEVARMRVCLHATPQADLCGASHAAAGCERAGAGRTWKKPVSSSCFRSARARSSTPCRPRPGCWLPCPHTQAALEAWARLRARVATEPAAGAAARTQGHAAGPHSR